MKKQSTKASKFDFRTIKSFDDACKKLGIDPSIPSDLLNISEKYRNPMIGHYKLMIIYEAINNGWTPDWSNWDQTKYFPWFRVLSSGFGFGESLYYCDRTLTTVGSRLCTDTSEKALYIANQFGQEYKEFFLYSE